MKNLKLLPQNKGIVIICIFIMVICAAWFLLLYGLRPDVLIALSYIALFAPAAVVDCRDHRIPNKIILVGYALGFVCLALFIIFGIGFEISVSERVIGMLLLPGAIFAVSRILEIVLKSSDIIGMGDIKALSVIGLAIGYEFQYTVLLLSLFFAVITGVFVAIRKRSVRFKLPMGPCLLAALVMIFPAVIERAIL